MVWREREKEMEKSWKFGEMSHSDDSDSFAEPAKVTIQWRWKCSFSHFILAWMYNITFFLQHKGA